MPHDIRLAGPWEFSTSGNSEWTRISLPWQASPAPEEALLARSFHRPPRLETGSRLFLLVVASDCDMRLRVNDSEILSVEFAETQVDEHLMVESRFDVTQSLNEFNRIVIQVDGRESSSVHSVKLRIEEPLKP